MIPMRQKVEAITRPRDDKTLSTYRDLCENRLRRLERYKKTKSFCELNPSMATTSASCHNLSIAVPESMNDDDRETESNSTEGSENSSESVSSSDTITLPKTPYELLREKMISLMENDVQLMQKLLTLASSIQELQDIREKQPSSSPDSRSPSRTSLTSEDEDDQWRPIVERQKFSASLSAITHLYVTDSDHGVEEEESEVENRPQQYFSRKNSVLRIPIKPRASNRMLGRRIPRRPSEMTRTGVESRVQPLATTIEDERLPLTCSNRHCHDSRDSEVSIDSGILDVHS
ncbi:hypothetical protein M3Y98_00549100 [Aphelenchoides besseyi]|nr:hypothetical protein M3Y98_00549100 [Aphelenchoides besseyi]